ncbi:unnamed protein product [Effrenium voratum]|nr:unnamed protein product [Effrenium voratum]
MRSRRLGLLLVAAVLLPWQELKDFVGLQHRARQSGIPRNAGLTLRYFDARGAAETVRLLFAAAGKEYKDLRYPISFGTPGDFSTIIRKMCAEWARRVHEAQMKRNPEEWEAAKKRIESARDHERQSRKCKAAKNHSILSRALAAEGLRQMSSAPASEHMAVQARWKSAQEHSTRHVSEFYEQMEAPRAPEVLDDEEDGAMAEAADLMGADVVALSALGNEGLEDGARPSSGGQGVDALLAQLRSEPADANECAAKFMLYEGYAQEVEQMRGTLMTFHEETCSTVPESVAADMGKRVKGIDSTEAMGIPDEAREWFVFHMMKQAERNNVSMARILEDFQKKLEFLAKNDQQECPVCLEPFEAEGEHAAATLGCCHKVCKECWETWSQLMHGRAFCPLCRHEEFLGEEFEEDRDAGKMDISMGKVPVLDVDGFSLPQSKAIERYLARELGMMGSTPMEEALVDAMAEHVRDINDAYSRKGLFFMKDQEKKAELQKKWYEEELPLLLSKLETALPGSDGFAVGEKVSLADIAIFKLLKDTYDADVSAAYGECPKLKAIVSKVEKNKGIQTWLSERPETMI